MAALQAQQSVKDAKAWLKIGRTLSAANRTRLAALAASLDELNTISSDIRSLLDETDPDKTPEPEPVADDGKGDVIVGQESATALAMQSQAIMERARAALSLSQ